MESITRTIWLKARQGDRASYDQLFALHAERAMLFIRARLGPALREKVEPQDVLQDAYLAAHQDFGKFEYTGDGAFLRWLCRIIENRIRDLGDYFAAGKRQPVELPRSDPTGPITALDRSEHRQKVSRALDRLSDDHRQVILLRYFETSFGISWQPADEDVARLLEIDFEALPKDVEIDGETIELSVAVRRATEVKLLSPAKAASVDLNTDILRWAAVPGAARYTVEVGFLMETGGMSFVAHLETTDNRLTLAQVDPRQRRAIRDELVAGRTGTWRVNAFDADGRRIGKTLDDGRFLVVKGLEDDS